MSKKIIAIVICMLMCVTAGAVAATININSNNKAVKAVSETSSSNRDIVWIQSNDAVTDTSSYNRDTWVHYDDGTAENSLGLSAGGTCDEAIKLTPTELAGLNGYITSIKVMHGCPAYPGCPATPYSAWIFTNANHPTGDPLAEATIVGTGTCPAIDNFYYINLTTPYAVAETDTVWVGVSWTHTAGSYPMGFDTSSCIAGKSDWLWDAADGWLELGGIGYPGNFNIWVAIGAGTTNHPPVTPAAPSGLNDGFINIEYQFNASTTDPEGDNISYMFDWGDSHNSGWVGPYASGAPAHASHIWTDSGVYQVKVKAKDENNAESNWSSTHTINIVSGPVLKIGNITGGLFKIKTTIKNIGEATANNIEWTINLTGGFVLSGKLTSGPILSLAPGSERTITSKPIIGFGKTVITITATVTENSAMKQQNATLLLFFIKIK